MKKEQILKKEDIEKLYFDERKSLKDTASVLNCSVTYLRKFMKMYGLPIRSNIESLQGHKGKKKEVKEINKDLLTELYVTQKMNLTTISQKFGVTQYIVKRFLNDYGIPIQSRKEAVQIIPWMRIIEKSSNDELKKLSWFELRGKEKKIINEAVKQKQKYITTNIDLSSDGYSSFINGYGKKAWISPEAYKKEKEQKQIEWQRNPEVRKNTHERCKTWNEANRERTHEWRKEWKDTESGKLSLAKSHHKQRLKGFIPLNKEIVNEPSDWHHIAQSLPFCINIPREIHQSVGGNSKHHFTKVNELAGYPEFNCGEKEDIEYYIELNYPEQFKEYWFGNY